MPTVASVDYVAKRIYLSATTVGAALDMLEVYRDVRELRNLTEAHRRYKPMIVAGGNITKTTTTKTQPYVQLLYGCRIVPYDQTHELLVTRETFTDDGFSGVDCFNRTGLVNQVDINYQVSPVEVRVVTTGGSALTTTEHDKLMGIPTNPLLTTDPRIDTLESIYTEMVRVTGNAGGLTFEQWKLSLVTLPTAEENAAAVWAKAVEGLTAEEIMRVMLAALAGKRQGIGTSTEQYLAQDGITPRISLTPTDSSGNGAPIINGAP